MYNCKICNNKITVYNSKRQFIYHIKNYHKLSVEDYFNRYEHITIGKCLFCDNTQSWNQRKLNYNKTCGNKSCVGKYAQRKSNESFKKTYGVDNPFYLNSIKEKSKQTKTERYGVPTYNNSNKNKETCLQKYGVDNASKSESVKNKIKESLSNIDKNEQQRRIKETNIKKYGKPYTFQNNVFKQKRILTSLEKYGTEYPFQNKEIYEERYIAKLKSKLNVINVSQIQQVNEKVKNTNFEKRKEYLNEKFSDLIIEYTDYKHVTLRCPACKEETTLNISFLKQRDKLGLEICTHCYPYKRDSSLQHKINDYINNLGHETILNYKIQDSNYEIDIYLPDKQIGFEINGVYWHSEIFKDKNYHSDKKNLGLKNGINIIHLWEDDLRIKEDIILNRIKIILGHSQNIGARKCEIKEIKSDTAKKFLEKYHLSGYINSAYKIGLFHDNEIISVVTFGKNRFKKENDTYEILRYASKDNIKVTGGFKKLINYFIKTYKPAKIITYIDLDWANGRNNIYEQSDFKFISYTKPDYYWVVMKKREYRSKFMKHKLLKEGYDNNKTESQIMHDRGFYRIWGCGNIKYEW